jgi:glucose dehydrogenase
MKTKPVRMRRRVCTATMRAKWGRSSKHDRRHPGSLRTGQRSPNNWPQYNRTVNAWRYSPLDRINKDNVGKLSVAWIAQGGDITMGNRQPRWR